MSPRALIDVINMKFEEKYTYLKKREINKTYIHWRIRQWAVRLDALGLDSNLSPVAGSVRSQQQAQTVPNLLDI